MHSDNWALALASGYIGGPAKNDAAADFQTGAGGNVRGFIDAVSRRALEAGEAGPRVVIAFPARSCGVELAPDHAFCRAPLRVTHARNAFFRSPDELLNFKASYGAFSDVPIELVPMEIADVPVTDADVSVQSDTERDLEIRRKRVRLDQMGGWAGAAVRLMHEATFDTALAKHFTTLATGGISMASSALLAFDPGAAEVDVEVWASTVSTLLENSGNQGFDRAAMLDRIGSGLSKTDESEAWIQGCRRIFNTEVDVPKLDDSRNIGRRAALGLMLAHKPSAVDELEESFGAGPCVRALISLAASAFTGLARLDREYKTGRSQLDGILEIAECLEEGRRLDVKFDGPRLEQDLSMITVISVNGQRVLERSSEPLPHLLMLKARAQEAGFTVRVDEQVGLVIQEKQGKGPMIQVQEDPDSLPEQPVARLAVELGQLKSRPTTDMLRRYLAAAWNNSCAIGLCERDGQSMICGFASLPLATLDRDEFLHHVRRLSGLAETLGDKPRKRRASRKADEGPQTKALFD
jgi:hypothetical protein